MIKLNKNLVKLLKYWINASAILISIIKIFKDP